VLSIPATGMQTAQSLLAVHAHNIANVSTEGFAGPDLVEDVVGLVVAKTMYTANAKVLAVLAETERSLLDVRA
jgi:flagellar hook protein FlgE